MCKKKGKKDGKKQAANKYMRLNNCLLMHMCVLL